MHDMSGGAVPASVVVCAGCATRNRVPAAAGLASLPALQGAPALGGRLIARQIGAASEGALRTRLEAALERID